MKRPHTHHDLQVLERLEQMVEKGNVSIRSVFLILLAFVASIAVVFLLVYGAFALVGLYASLSS